MTLSASPPNDAEVADTARTSDAASVKVNDVAESVTVKPPVLISADVAATAPPVMVPAAVTDLSTKIDTATNASQHTTQPTNQPTTSSER